jgi:broad specificity phosphatase PhoE
MKGHEALLTENGHLQAERFGEELGRAGHFRVFCSPVERCRQTARGIIKGAGWDTEPRDSEWLAYGYIRDFPLLLSRLPPGGFEEMILSFISRRKFTGLTDLETGSREILNNIRKESGGEPAVFISHDAVIMPFLARFTEMDFSSGGWLDYLNGACIVYGKDSQPEISQFPERFSRT